MTDDAKAYIDAIKATHRPLFDGVSRLIHETFPDEISDDELRNLVREALSA